MHKSSITRKLFVLLMTLCVVMSYFPMAFAADEVTNDSQGAKNAAAEEVQDKADEAKPKEDPQPEKKAEEAPKAEEPKAEPAAQDKADEGKTDEAKPAEEKTDAAKTEEGKANEAKPSDKEDETKAEEDKTDEAKVASETPAAEEPTTEEPPLVEETDPEPGEIVEIDEDVAYFYVNKADIDGGDTISYDVDRIGKDNHKPYFHTSDHYDGICMEIGKSAKDGGGKAKVTALAKTDKVARAAYYVAVVKNWWPTGRGYGDAPTESQKNSRINKAERIVQMAGNYNKTIKELEDSGNYTADEIQELKDLYSTAQTITPPASFEVFKAVPTNDSDNEYQDFVLFKYHEGSLRVHKTPEMAAQEYTQGASLANAVYYVYTDAACTTRATDRRLQAITLTTDASGYSNVATLATGKYYIKEITASPGYALDTKAREVTVTEANTTGSPATAESKEPPKPTFIYVKKQAEATDTNFRSVAPNNYSLAGAVYHVFTDAACQNRAVDLKTNSPAVLTTDADGKTNTVKLPLKATPYYVKEVTASKGYKLDTTTHPVSPTEANTEANPAPVNSTEPPAHGIFTFMLYKQNFDFGYRRLLGAEYTLSYYDIDQGYANGSEALPTEATISGKTPTKQWKFVTREGEDSDGKKVAMIDFAKDTPTEGGEMFKEGDNVVLPNGVFTLKETKCPVGVGCDPETYYGEVQQIANGEASKSTLADSDAMGVVERDQTTRLVHTEPRKHAIFRLQKVTIDPETHEVIEDLAAAIADRKVSLPSLEGAEYEVYMEDTDYITDQYCGKIVTDENGYGELKTDEHDDDQELRAGSYYFIETKAAPGHALDKEAADAQTGDFRKEKHYFKARFDDSSDELEYYFDLESADPIKPTYFHKTDVTGDCPELEGATLQVINSDGKIVETWESKADEPHKILGLPNGTYTLREITAPYGYDQAEDVEFTVVDNVVEQHVHMDNKPVKIKTNAVDAETMTRIGKFSDKEKVIDTVTFENLYAGRKYTFTGTLMDKNESTAENPVPLKDKDGNEVKAEKTVMFDENGKVVEEYNGEKGVLISGSVDLEFEFDASEFTKEKTVVAFEEVSNIKGPIAAHADLNDEDQTIHFGGIVETVATDAETKSHNILAGKNAKITDKVTYKNLAPGETYVVKGQLYDKTTGKVLEGVKAEPVTFTAEATDGTVEMTFSFDATGLETHALVAYEELFVKATIDGQNKEVFVDEHKNPEDEDQTVWVPQIRTNATDLKTGDHIANANDTVTVKDVVTYKNLIPGKTYEMKGKLMDKQTRKVLKVNGKEVTASRTFTPKTPDGSVELTFSFKGNDFAGKSVVAFESCTIIGGGPTPVAVHEDFNDADQTVQLPKIATKAGKKNKDGYIVDTVKYWNLIPGREYIVRGYLVKKSNGDEIADSEGEFRFTPSTPNGKVYVELDPGDATGKLVAFEEIYIIDTKSGTPREILVGEHADLDDAAQTVNVPSKHKKPKTGDDVMFIFIGGIFGLSAALYLVLRRRQKMMNK